MYKKFIKRGLDILFSLVALIVFIIPMLIVAIAIKVEDPKGKIIFGHKRVGKNGKLFPWMKVERSCFGSRI